MVDVTLAGQYLEAAHQALAEIRDGRVEAHGMTPRQYARLYLEIGPTAVAEAIEREKKMEALLRWFEWKFEGGIPGHARLCPSCLNTQAQGHRPDCPYGAVLG